MNDDLFGELMMSIREGGAILRGNVAPSRAFAAEEPDVNRIRFEQKLSQHELATLPGVSIATLRNWEHDRQVPRGSTRILLMIMARHPEAVWEVAPGNNVV